MTSDQSPETSGRTLVGVWEPAVTALWVEPSEDEDEDPDPNDDGSDLETAECSFLERKRRLGLSLRFLGLMLMSFIGGGGG